MRKITDTIVHEHEFAVSEKETVPNVFPEVKVFQEMPQVFATAYMVGFMEWTCMEALAPYVEDDERTVGISVNVSHIAATPVGMKVRCRATLLEADGNRTKWKVQAYDEKDLIGEGTHERFTVNNDKFLDKLAQKAAK